MHSEENSLSGHFNPVGRLQQLGCLGSYPLLKQGLGFLPRHFQSHDFHSRDFHSSDEQRGSRMWDSI